MKKYHITAAVNIPLIFRDGLLTRFSKGKRKAVWCVSASMVPWACMHTLAKIGGTVESLAVLEIDVPRSWMRKHGKGLWYIPRDVPRDRIRKAVGFSQIARER